MAAFPWDTDVSSPTRRVARLGLVGGCWVITAGVVASVVYPVGPPPIRMTRTDAPDRQSILAAGVISTPVPRPAPGVELLRDAGPASRVVYMTVTAYCPCPICCGPGADGVTASGKKVAANYGHFAAAPPELPFGTRLVVPGYNRDRPVPVLDRGGSIKGDKLDVFFPTHGAAKKWGVRRLPVTIDPPAVR